MPRLPRIVRRHLGWPRRRILLVALGALIVLLVLGAGGHPKSYGATTHPTATVPAGSVILLAADKTPAPNPTSPTTPTTTTPPGCSGSGSGPTGIQVGPGGTTSPSTPTPGSGGSVSGGSQPSPGLFDITGHIEAAIDDWFRDLVTAALNPILDLLGHTLLATPNVTAQSRVGQLWQMTEGIADAFLVLFVLVGGAIVMGHETVQTRTAIQGRPAPHRRAPPSPSTPASRSPDSSSRPPTRSPKPCSAKASTRPEAAVVLRQLVLGSLADGGIFVVLLGGVVAVLGHRAARHLRLSGSPWSSCSSSPRRSAWSATPYPKPRAWPSCGGGPSSAPSPSKSPSPWSW